MAGKLEGEVAVITGSDSGIGQATAIAFAREGCDVAVSYRRDKEGAEHTKAEVEKLGRKAIVVHVDLIEHYEVIRLFEEARDKLGLVTVLVNNAGTGGGDTVKDMKISDWDWVIRANLYGAFYCAQQFIRGIEGSGRHGVIINVTSVHEDAPVAGNSAYCAAKGGLRNLTRCLALELAEKEINVVNIAPGMILTPMNQEAKDDPKKYEEAVQRIPQKRAGQPEEIANLAVFLASKEARYIHGTTIFCDGGLMQNVAPKCNED